MDGDRGDEAGDAAGELDDGRGVAGGGGHDQDVLEAGSPGALDEVIELALELRVSQVGMGLEKGVHVGAWEGISIAGS
jgi:hypothetical protein